MSKRYLLSSSTAEKLKTLLNGHSASGRLPANGPGVTSDADLPPPFAVTWSESASSWLVYCPANALFAFGEYVSPTATLEAPEGYPTGFFKLSSIAASGGSVYLNILVDDAGEEDTTASFDDEPADPEEGQTATSIIIATVTKSDDGVTVNQIVVGAIVLGDGASIATDRLSIDRLGDSSALEFAHFIDGERDSTLGLDTRLIADTETGEITATDSSLMLVCRQNGQIVYVPMSGSGSDPEAPSGTGEGPCDHPQSDGSGGINPDNDVYSSETKEEQNQRAGGVSPDDGDSVHPCDHDCNCP